MQSDFYRTYLNTSEYNKQKLLAVMNPEKLRALAFLLSLARQARVVKLLGCEG